MNPVFILAILLMVNRYLLFPYLLTSKKSPVFASSLPILTFNEKALAVNYYNTFLKKQLKQRLPKFGAMPVLMLNSSTNGLG